MATIAFAAAATAAISALSSALDRKKPPLSDLQITSSAYGDALPIVYGTARVGTRLIWSDGLKTVHQNKFGKAYQANGTGATAGSSKKGKITGGKKTSNAQTMTANLGYGICEGPIDDLLVIWANGTVIFDKTGTYKNSTTGELVNEGNYRFAFYKGTSTQLPDPMIKAWTEETYGPGSTPAYRDWAYITFEDLDLTAWGGSIPELHCQVTRVATPAYPATEMTPLPNSVFGGSYAMDWSTGLLYSSVNNGITIYDVNALEQTAEVVLTGTNAGGGLALGLIPGRYAVLGGLQPYYGNYTIIDLNSLQTGNLDVAATPIEVELNILPYSITGFVLSGTPWLVMSTELGKNVVAQSIPGALEVIATLEAGDNYLLMVPFVEGAVDTVYGVPAQTNNTTLNIYVFDAAALFFEVQLQNKPFALAPAAAISLADDLGLTTPSAGEWGWAIALLEVDQTDGGLLVMVQGGSGTCLFKWLSGQGIIWSSLEYSTSFPGVGLSLINNQKFGFPGSVNGVGSYVLISTVDGSLLWSAPFSDYTEGPQTPTAICYDGIKNACYIKPVSNAQCWQVLLDRSSANGDTLAFICSDIAERSGLAATQFDTTALTTAVGGYAFARRASGKEAIDQLAKIYFFDVVESDNILKFPLRGQSPVLTITQDDLGETRGGDGSSTGDDNYWKQTRKQEVDLPVQLEFSYFDSGLGLLKGTQYAKRVQAPAAATNARAYASMTAPIIMSATQAAQVADKVLWTEWIERDTFAATLSWKYTLLDPSDVVTVTLADGSSYNVRLTKTDLGADWSIPTSFVNEDETTYQSAAVGGTGTLFTTANTVNVVAIQTIALDLPYLADTDEDGTNYALVFYGSGLLSNSQWLGAAISKNVNSAGWVPLGASGTPVFWGTLAAPLPPTVCPFMVDNSYTITVQPFRGATGSLASCTITDLLNGTNQAAVGGEIIQFLNAVANANGTWTLSGILRGMRGTDPLCDFHQAGETFVLLDRGKLGVDPYPFNAIGQVADYDAAPLGASFDAGQQAVVTFAGAALKPYAPCQIGAASDGNGGTTITWSRRTRMFGGLEESTGTVPLNEASEQYAVYVLAQPYSPSTFSPSNSSTYLRAVTGLTAPSFDYTEAMQQADGLVAGANLNVVVYQVSAAVGLGFPGFRTLLGAAA